MRKLLTLISLLAVLSLVLTACGGGATPTEAPAAATEPPATVLPATEAPAAALCRRPVTSDLVSQIRMYLVFRRSSLTASHAACALCELCQFTKIGVQEFPARMASMSRAAIQPSLKDG